MKTHGPTRTALLRRRRPDVSLAGYLAPGYAFSRRPGTRPETVILIHGWGVRAGSMTALARMLNCAGYAVWNYDYPSSERSIRDHAAAFLAAYRRERPLGKIFFLTHSMGGLLLRHALAMMGEAECRAIDSIVMLGPPNRGSLLALPGMSTLVRALNASLADMIPGSAALCIPPPAYLPPVGIVAGSLDGKVPLGSTGLPGDLPYRRAVVPCTHPGLRQPRNTGTLILNFLRYHEFDR